MNDETQLFVKEINVIYQDENDFASVEKNLQ